MVVVKLNGKELENSGIILSLDDSAEGLCSLELLQRAKAVDASAKVTVNGDEIADGGFYQIDSTKNELYYYIPNKAWRTKNLKRLYVEVNIYGV